MKKIRYLMQKYDDEIFYVCIVVSVMGIILSLCGIGEPLNSDNRWLRLDFWNMFGK